MKTGHAIVINTVRLLVIAALAPAPVTRRRRTDPAQTVEAAFGLY